MLREVERDTDFSFALGADTFLDLTNWKWRQSKDVLRLLEGRFVVFARQDTCDKTLQERIDAINRDESGNVRFLSVPTLTGVSSTMVRSCANEQELRDMVVPGVLDYIKGHDMYQFSKEP
jgi:nicotinic acid mononucleotide adenylyltransferase